MVTSLQLRDILGGWQSVVSYTLGKLYSILGSMDIMELDAIATRPPVYCARDE